MTSDRRADKINCMAKNGSGLIYFDEFAIDDGISSNSRKLLSKLEAAGLSSQAGVLRTYFSTQPKSFPVEEQFSAAAAKVNESWRASQKKSAALTRGWGDRYVTPITDLLGAGTGGGDWRCEFEGKVEKPSRYSAEQMLKASRDRAHVGLCRQRMGYAHARTQLAALHRTYCDESPLGINPLVNVENYMRWFATQKAESERDQESQTLSADKRWSLVKTILESMITEEDKEKQKRMP